MSKVEETEDNFQGDAMNFKSYRMETRQIQNFAKMSNMRIIQKRLVYVIGLSGQMAFKDNLLSRFEYFGQYGKITKLVVNKNKVYNMNGPNGPSYSAYVTFQCPEESSLAILALDNSIVDNHLLRASYGTTKYCSNFLRGVDCLNRECLYLHFYADEEDIIDRDDMNTNKSIFTSQHLLAVKICDIFNPEKRSKLLSMKLNRTFLPSPHLIYEKEIVIEQFRKKCEALSAACTYENSQIQNNLYQVRPKSRFNFIQDNSQIDEPIDIPNFVHHLIYKKYSRYSFFKKLVKDDEDFTYFDRILIREYNERNPWARFIVSQNKNETVKVFIEKMAEDEEIKLLNKFKTA